MNVTGSVPPVSNLFIHVCEFIARSKPVIYKLQPKSVYVTTSFECYG